METARDIDISLRIRTCAAQLIKPLWTNAADLGPSTGVDSTLHAKASFDAKRLIQLRR